MAFIVSFLAFVAMAVVGLWAFAFGYERGYKKGVENTEKDYRGWLD